MEVYKTAIENFLPTPVKSHYTFSLRDFARVISGCLLVPQARLKEQEKFVRLWAHETYRVFNDRLIDDNDREMLLKIVHSATYTHWRIHLHKALSPILPEGEELTGEAMRSLMFGNYGEPDSDLKYYDEINPETVPKLMQGYLDDYNMVNRNRMDLVLFQFAIEHISRISRVLLQDSGHALLVGIGGSGRHSAVKLATNMAESLIFQVN